SGGPWVQTTRLISYFFGLIILIFAIVAPIAAASGAISKRRRRKHVDQFKSHTKIEPNAQHEFIFERYVENDLGYLRMLQRVAADEGRLQFEVRRYERRKAKQRDVEHIEPRILVSSTGAPPSYIFQNMLP